MKLKKIAVMAVGAILMIALHGTAANAWEHMKIRLCHATHSSTNPYVSVTVAAPSIVNGGHGLHADDIIPPFSWENGGHYDGKNWNYFTASIWQHDCKVAQPGTTTTTSTSSTSTSTSTTVPATDTTTTSTTTVPDSSTTVPGSSSTTTVAHHASTTSTTIVQIGTPASQHGGTLPFSGGDIGPAVFVALGLIGAGLLACRAKRKDRIA